MVHCIFTGMRSSSAVMIRPSWSPPSKTKFFIGFLAGLIAHRSGNISLGRDVLGASVGSVTYVALYLLKSFIMKFYIEGQALGAVQTQLVTKGVTSLINAVLAVVVSVLLAKAVRPALRKAGILSE